MRLQLEGWRKYGIQYIIIVYTQYNSLCPHKYDKLSGMNNIMYNTTILLYTIQNNGAKMRVLSCVMNIYYTISYLLKEKKRKEILPSKIMVSHSVISFLCVCH